MTTTFENAAREAAEALKRDAEKINQQLSILADPDNQDFTPAQRWLLITDTKVKNSAAAMEAFAYKLIPGGSDYRCLTNEMEIKFSRFVMKLSLYGSRIITIRYSGPTFKEEPRLREPGEDELKYERIMNILRSGKTPNQIMNLLYPNHSFRVTFSKAWKHSIKGIKDGTLLRVYTDNYETKKNDRLTAYEWNKKYYAQYQEDMAEFEVKYLPVIKAFAGSEFKINIEY